MKLPEFAKVWWCMLQNRLPLVVSLLTFSIFAWIQLELIVMAFPVARSLEARYRFG